MALRAFFASDAFYLLAFFVVVILVGSFLLYLPAAWEGPGRLSYVDALFTAASAVCVTGLITVDTASFSLMGKTVIMSLIQIGGLGIISFSTLHLVLPGFRIPLRRRDTIRGFYVEGVEYEPLRIVRNIMLFTFLIQGAGVLALWADFRAAGVERPWFTAAFHTVAAFCNAGFSTFSTNLEAFADRPTLLGSIMLLIVTGGLGFVVIDDLVHRVRERRRRLAFHTRVVLIGTGLLIATATAAFLWLERDGVLAGLPPGLRFVNALFQAVTPRTAGFNTLVQADLSLGGKFITMLLMFVGGAPGSIAGGVKITTFFIIIAILLRPVNDHGEIQTSRRRLTLETTNKAVVFFLKAASLLAVSIFLLFLSEPGADPMSVVFEAVSAFGTVGLSLGLTPQLSTAGKLIIIATMFAGRVGLLALAFPATSGRRDQIVYPVGDILLG